MSGEGKGDGEGKDEGVLLLLLSFGVICREKAGVRVTARASHCRREGEGVVEGALSRAVNRIPYKLYVRYRHTGAVPYQRLLSNLTTVTVLGW